MGNIKTRCVIIGGGDCSVELLKLNISTDDYIICADSGYDIAVEARIQPDLVIGDFDSVKGFVQNADKITLPVEKDVTDCLAAYNEGIKQGFTKFLLLGGTGGRFEHTFANISVMANASKDGNEFRIIDDKHIFYAITDSSIKISFSPNKQISVFAFGDKAFGVTEKGFHYSIENYTLNPFIPIGISNDIVSDFGEISVEKGTLIIIETQM
ncbi:MAG: thiamine diphosphokinase [Clostridia bacterium]|nr:thiamine diphosphokinase [Clostridia bacterium]